MKSKDKLKKVSHHLCYEYEQLVNTARILGDCPCGQSTYNVLLDSFALHVRNLVDFLYTENPGSDDVYAGDFFASKQNWIDIRPAITPILEEAKKLGISLTIGSDGHEDIGQGIPEAMELAKSVGYDFIIV